jgi:DNA-binding transcriptional ArsR family regulator
MGQFDNVKHSLILKALSDPVSLKILEVLFNNEFCVNELSDALNLKQATSSHHLGILKTNGIIHLNKQGSRAFYSVKNDLVKRIISIVQLER